jgi:hypothetical protein
VSIKRKPKKSSKEGGTNSSAKNSPAAENKSKQTKRPRNPFNKMEIEAEILTSDNSVKPESHKPGLMATEQHEATNPDQREIKEGVSDAEDVNKAPSVPSKRGNKQKNFNHRGRGGSRNRSQRISTNDNVNTNGEKREENSMQVESGTQQVVFKGSVPKSFNFGRGRGRGLQNKSPARSNYFQRTGNATNVNEAGNDVQMKN